MIIIVPLQFQTSGVILCWVERNRNEKGIPWLGCFRLLAPKQGTVQQIMYMLIVDLKEWNWHCDLSVFFGSLNLIHHDSGAPLHQPPGVWAALTDPRHYDSLLILSILVSLHSEGLPGACLSISENGRMVTLHDSAHHFPQACLVKNLFLVCTLLKDFVESVGSSLLWLVWWMNSTNIV